MSESTQQGIPFKDLGNNLRLYKSNDISFKSLKKEGFKCNPSVKKPDQFVAHMKHIIIGIEDKLDSSEIDIALAQLETNYLDALPETKFFIARAGDEVKVFHRNRLNELIEMKTVRRGKTALCFGARVITGENVAVEENLKLLSEAILGGTTPVNDVIEIDPPKQYFNPLIVKHERIFSLWQKLFMATGKEAHICLMTFIELLLYKGISDAKLLPTEYSIGSLCEPGTEKPLDTYRKVVRTYIRDSLFPTSTDQPGVVNDFAFAEQETSFKEVLKDLNELGNLAQRQLDPDFKRRIIEAFLGSGHSEGKIKDGKHLTPRVIIQAIWEMAEPKEGKRIVDPACGVGGFILEGLNYPYEYDVMKLNNLGIDRDEQMVIAAKANMILHLLDKLASADGKKRKKLNSIIHATFLLAQNNGTGTLGELSREDIIGGKPTSTHPADYVLTNIPFVTRGVDQINNSLDSLGLKDFYEPVGLGVEGRFLVYILDQIKNGDPGIAYIIITDGVLRRHNDKSRKIITDKADILGIISLPRGCFQNNNWKTSILVLHRKSAVPEYAPVFLYDVDNIGISLDAYRTPIPQNDIPSLKEAWKKRLSGKIDDPKCKLVSREEFLNTNRWSDLFSYRKSNEDDENLSFSEFIESSEAIINETLETLNDADRKLGKLFSFEDFEEIELGDIRYFKVNTAPFKTTVGYARLHPGKYPLFSSKTDGPIEYMFDSNNAPLLFETKNQAHKQQIISWNIKGDAGKDVRLHHTPFYVTENRGLICITSKDVSWKYLWCYLREHLVAAGGFSRENEAHANKVRKIKIRLPRTHTGISIELQEEIAANYETINDLRTQIKKNLAGLSRLVENIDVFK